MGNEQSQVAGEYTEPEELPGGTREVRLTVYKLPFFGAGAVGGYHSGVVLDGREWSFGGGDGPGTGVYSCTPERNECYTFKQRVVMGTTTASDAELSTVLQRLAAEWPRGSYKLLERNCNHFSSHLLKELVGRPAPAFVNQLAEGLVVGPIKAQSRSRSPPFRCAP